MLPAAQPQGISLQKRACSSYTACPVVLPPRPLSLSPADALSGMGLLWHRDLRMLEGFGILETPCQCPPQTGDMACISCPMGALGGLWHQESLGPRTGQYWPPPRPLGKFRQIGKAEAGVVLARGCGSVKFHLLTTGQSWTTLGFGDFLLPCSPRPSLLSEWWGRGD